MSGRQTIDYDPVEALLDQGRRDLAAGQPEKARWCFEEVLRRRPTDARALLGMSYVERHSERPIGDGASILNADLEVVKLVKDKRYDEALDLLRRELLARPGDEALQKSITHLQRHIQRRSGPPPAKEAPTDQGRSKVASSKVKSDASSKVATSAPTSTKDLKRPSEAVDTKDIRPPKNLSSMDSKGSGGAATKASRSASEPGASDIATAAHDTAPHDTAPHDTAPHDTAPHDTTPHDTTAPRTKTAPNGSLDAAPITGVRQKSPPAPPESDNDLDVQLPMREDVGSSGGVRLADEMPSGPALGSLPPAPAPAAEPASSSAFWFVLLVVVAVAVAIWALRA